MVTPLEQIRRLTSALDFARASAFLQDCDLRYVWVATSVPFFSEGKLLGKTDAEVLAEETARQIVPLKRSVISTGRGQNGEFFHTLPSGERRWYSVKLDPWLDQDGTTLGVFTAALDVTDQRLMDERLVVLMREVAHRSKNLLAIIQGLSNQTARTSSTIAEFASKFTGRLLSLGHAQDLLTATDWQGASIDDLIKFQLGPYLEAYDRQILTHGRPMMLKSNAAQYLGLALHELVTNAAKHGTLLEASGEVSISWRIVTGETPRRNCFILVWSERGLSRLRSDWEGERGGFGRTMLTKITPQAIQGQALMRFRQGGIVYRLAAPLTEIATDDWLYRSALMAEMPPA